MDVFGRLKLNLHQNPESIDAVLQDDLVEVAQSAFTTDGFPTEEDVKQHIIPSDSVITAEVDGEAIGFASTDSYGDQGIVYAAGISVDPEYQGMGVGRLMRTRGVLEEMQGTETVTTRTQNPTVLDYMQDLFNAYPVQGEQTPDDVEEDLEALADILDPEAGYEDHVMQGAYGGPANSELPDGYESQEEYIRNNLDIQNGDALLAGGETDEEALQKTYDEMVQNRDYDVLEEAV